MSPVKLKVAQVREQTWCPICSTRYALDECRPCGCDPEEVQTAHQREYERKVGWLNGGNRHERRSGLARENQRLREENARLRNQTTAEQSNG